MRATSGRPAADVSSPAAAATTSAAPASTRAMAVARDRGVSISSDADEHRRSRVAHDDALAGRAPVRYRGLTTTRFDMSSRLPTTTGPAAASCCAPSAGLDAALDADRIATIAKALGEPVRVRILDVVRRSDEPVCQCELIA